MALQIISRLLAKSDPISDQVQVARIPLKELINDQRRSDLLRSESYYRCTHNDHKNWAFDGTMIGTGGWGRIHTNDYIPMRLRRPSVRMDLARVIVDRLTSLVLGNKHFPTIKIEGDPDAEDYVRTLAKESKLPSKMIEARNKGGSTGTSVLSWSFVDGKPIIDVHTPAFIEVLEWASWPERKPSKVLKVYEYLRRTWSNQGRQRWKLCYYARYWDESIDVTWEAIPEEYATKPNWHMQSYKMVRHDCGFCPVYIVQNIPDEDSVDGVSDYFKQEDGFDEIDQLLSAAFKGGKLNVDPTVVILDDPGNNDGVLHKGSEHAIYSAKGAKYLELSGTGIEASLKIADKQRLYELDKACVVLQDPEKTGGGPQSAAAMRTRFNAMVSKCDIIRDQYGPTIVAILKDMLEISRKLKTTIKTDEDGNQYWSHVVLPPRVEKVSEEEDGKETFIMMERAPGSSSSISLDWPPYFPPTWEDKQIATKTAKEASGGQPVISQRTAVESISTMFGVEDVDAEIRRIKEDGDHSDERAGRLLERGTPNLSFQGEEEEEEEEDLEDKVQKKDE